MHENGEVLDIRTESRHLGAWGERLARVAGGAGVALLVVAAVLGWAAGDHGRTFFFGWLLNFAFVLSLALGALFFVLIQHLTRAGWSVVVRRLAEGLAGTLPLLAILFLPLLGGLHQLYHWTHADAVATDALLQAKQPYLNVPFFLVRCAFYLAVWALISHFYLRRSIEQDGTGDAGLTEVMQRRSAPAMVAFALTVTFASFDLLMSLDPHWYSTIFGVYYFAGCLVGFFALLPLLSLALQRRGLLRQAISVEHYHDLGKFLFAFVVFWAYIAFSQYMLYWYANLPEETGWFLRRQSGGWGWVALLLIFGHFALPFVLLLGRAIKRRPAALAGVAGWALLMHWIDLFWLVKPELSRERFSIHAVDVVLLLAMSALLVAALAWRLRGTSLVPERDPRLAESLTFENA